MPLCVSLVWSLGAVTHINTLALNKDVFIDILFSWRIIGTGHINSKGNCPFGISLGENIYGYVSPAKIKT